MRRVKHILHRFRRAPRSLYRTVFFWRRLSPKYRVIFTIAIITLGAIGIPLFMSVLKNIQSAQAAWFNDNWAYRKAIDVTNSGSQQGDVYINMTGADDLDTSDTTRFQADCGDIRFTKQNGELLPYYIVSGCGSADTVIHVNFDVFPAGDQIIYVYYGNPSAPNGFNTKDFRAEASSYTIGSQASEENAPSPQHYWRFDEGSGNVASSSATTKKEALLFNGVSWKTEELCIVGKCLSLDGTDDFAQVNSPSLPTGDFTYSVWVNPKDTTTNSIVMASEGNGNNELWITITSASKLQVFVDSATALTTDKSIPTNTWTHVAVTRSGASIKAYINGVADAQTGSDSDALNFSTCPFYIGLDVDTSGCSGSPGDYFNGFIEELKVYNFALSAAQVKANYNARGGNMAGAVLGEYDDAFLSNGLVGYWKMDETAADGCTGGSNDNCDSSGNGFDGAWTGDATASTSAKFGAGGKFDGSGDYVAGTNSPDLSGSSTVTATTWFKLSGSGAGTQNLFQFGATGTTFEARASSTSMYCGLQTTGGGFQAFQVVQTVSVNVWHHIVCVYDGSYITMYYDGAFLSRSSHTGPLVSGVNYYLGSRGGGNYLEGVLDEVRVYKRVFSPTEIEKLYSWAPGPVTYYDFEEGIGNSAKDRSGNGINGTITGATYTTGKYGKALNLDGDNDYVSFTTSRVTSHNGSMSIWVKSSADYSGGEGIIFYGCALSSCADGFGSENETHLDFDNSPANTMHFFQENSSSDTNIRSSNALNDGKWHHVVATWDKVNTGYSRLYVDGINVASAVSTSNAYDFDDFYIGIAESLTRDLTGQIDEARLYNYALTSKQVVQLMNGGHPAVGSPVGSAIGHWKFDAGFGNVASNSGNLGNAANAELHDIVLNPPRVESGWTQEGKFGKAIRFDGSSDYLRVRDQDALDLTGAFTISAWIQPFSFGSGTDEDRIVYKGLGGHTDNLYTFDVDESNVVLSIHGTAPPATQCNGTTEKCVRGSTTLQARNWYYVTATFDGSTKLRVYVNGKLDGEVTLSAASTGTANSSHVHIGGRQDWSDMFHGTIDELKIYNYALSSSEVKLDMNQGKSLVLGSFGTSTLDGKTASHSAAAAYCVPGDTTTASCQPVGEWRFEEKMRGAANDTSGYGANGVITEPNKTWWTKGKVGSALHFESTMGGSPTVSAGNPSQLNITGALSLSGWVRLDPNGSTGASRGIITKGTAISNTAQNYQLVMDSNENVIFQVSNGTVTGVTGPDLTNDRAWHHYVAVYVPSTALRIYVDGKLFASNTTSIPASISTDSNNFNIGNVGALSQRWQGEIDEVKVYNYALSAAQVAWDYNRGKPIAYYDFNECEGSTLNEYYGNAALNGTITLGASGETTVGTCLTSSSAWGDGASGKYTASLSFDGVSDYINIGSNATLGTALTNLSVSAWIKKTTNNTIDAFVWHDVDSNASSYRILSLDTGVMEYNVGDFSTGYTCTGTDINDTNWHHVAMTFDGSTLRGYFDTKLDCTDASGSYTAANAVTWIGAGDVGSQNYWMDGQIDEVQIFNYPLTAYQVKMLYNQSSGIRFGPVTGTP